VQLIIGFKSVQRKLQLFEVTLSELTKRILLYKQDKIKSEQCEAWTFFQIHNIGTSVATTSTVGCRRGFQAEAEAELDDVGRLGARCRPTAAADRGTVLVAAAVLRVEMRPGLAARGGTGTGKGRGRLRAAPEQRRRLRAAALRHAS
jgi:hypothetical protein